MIFGRKKIKDLAPNTYSRFFWKRFKKNKVAVWSLRVLIFLVVIALFADFIANDKPIYCKIEGKAYYPIFHEYLVDWKLRAPDAKFINKNWYVEHFDRVIWPLIPYAATTIDSKNMQFAHPFKKQRVESLGFRHWLGTNQIGRDVAAGLVSGIRIALTIGILAMSIATIIGIAVGGIAGFYGDQSYQLSIIRLILNTIFLLLGTYWVFTWLTISTFSNWLINFTGIIIIYGISLSFSNFLATLLERNRIFAKTIFLPLDLLIMRFIEVINSVPGLLLLLALIPLLKTRSIYNIMIIIGLIGWTGIARFIRAELLRIRSLEYIEAGKTLGFNSFRLLFRHALPNAIGPVLVAIAFGIASAILLEAYLSFLGLGLPQDAVTWGRQLNEARSATKAWWMAIFPGFAIFLTVTIFNLLGEGISDALGTTSSSNS